MRAAWLLAVVILMAGVVGCSKTGLRIGGAGTRIQATLSFRTTTMPPGEKWDATKEQDTARVLRDRLQTIGVSPSVTSHGKTFDVEVSTTRDRDAVLKYLTTPGKLEFRHMASVHYVGAQRWRPVAGKYEMSVDVDAKTGREEYHFEDTDEKAVASDAILGDSKLVLTEADLRPVTRAAQDPQNTESVVSLEFTMDGRRKFSDFTRRNVNEILAIVLDGNILSAPSINEPILNGRAIIRGRFTQDETRDLADMLNAGSLPAPLEVVK